MHRWLNRLLILAVLATIVVVTVAGYAHLVSTGVAPPVTPELLRQIEESARNVTRDATSLMIVIAIAVPLLLTALAPFVLAIRSEDVLTVVISIVLMIGVWLLVFTSRTSIDLCAAALIYAANMILSVGMYIAKSVAAAARKASMPAAYDGRS